MPQTAQDFTDPGTILKPFPVAEDVFIPDHIHLIRHLHPLVSVDLQAVNPAWPGWAHVLSPIEPFKGALGEHTTEFHNDFLRKNSLVFKLENDRYRFLGDARYFFMEWLRDDVPEDKRLDYDALADHYKVAEESYRLSEASYRKRGKLHWITRNGHIGQGNPAPQPLIEQLGGPVGFGNWTVLADFPVYPSFNFGENECEPDEVWPLSPAGNRFEHVVSVGGWPYRNDGADTILLFYEPIERLALLTFEWT